MSQVFDTFTVKVTDALGASVSKVLQLAINQPVVSNIYKFNTGIYGVAGMAGVGGGGTAAYTDTSVTPPVTYQVNTNLAGFLNNQLPGNNAVLSGIFTSIHATLFQQAGQGLFSFDGSANDPFLSAYRAVQGFWRTARGIAKGDQCRFGLMVGWAQNTGGANNTKALILGAAGGGTGPGYSFAGSSGVVPPFIRDCAKTTYPLNGKTVGFADIFDNVGYVDHGSTGPVTWNPGGSSTRYYFGIQPGNQQCGHAYSGFTGANYITVGPTVWELGVEKDRLNTLFALSVYKLPYTDASGAVTWYTLDQHPLIEFLWLADETSVNIDQSEAGMVPVSIDNLNFPLGNQCSATGYWASYFDCLAALFTNFPSTEWGAPWNFQFKTGRSDDDTNTTYNTKLPQVAAAYKNIALCGPDGYGASWTATPQATTAQQTFIGIASPTAASLGAIVAANDLRGIMDNVWQLQDGDWNHHTIGGHGNYTVQTAADMMAAGCANTAYSMKASRILAWNTTDRFLTSDWGGYIYPALVAASTANPVNSAVPSNLQSPLVFFPLTAPPAAQGVPYELIVSVTNDPGPINFSVSGAAWVSATPLSATAVLLSGTPPAQGSNSITLNALSTSTHRPGSITL